MEREKRKEIWCFGIILGLLLVFFIKIHPLIIWDTDDWWYLSYVRNGFPLWKNWEPGRIFPEIFMPLCSYFGKYCIMPFTNDYIGALAISYGGILSLFITIYFVSFYKFIRRKTDVSFSEGICLTFLFCVFHFLVFRSQENNNQYMFWNYDVTSCFFYTIPCLLNLSLIMNLDVINQKRNTNYIFKGIVLTLIYLAIFSNLFASYIIAVWAGIEIVFDFFEQSQIDFKKFFLKNRNYFFIIVGWIISAFFEINGGRAGSLNTNSYSENIKETVKFLLIKIDTVNKMFAFFSVLVIVIGGVIIIKKESEKCQIKFAGKILIAIILSAVYLIMLSAKSVNWYIQRADVLFGLMFWIFFLDIYMLITLSKNYERTKIIYPLLLFLMIFDLHSGARTFAPSNVSQIDSDLCKKIDDEIIEQIKLADKQGKTEMQLHIPKTQGDNWPFGQYASNRFAYSLYAHGIISRPIETEMIQDEEINKKYGLYNIY